MGGFNRFLLLCIPSGCGHPLGQQCLFVTLDRERRFTLVVVVVAGGHAFHGGLSYPGLLCCLALSLQYDDMLYLWLCAHSLLDQGVRGLLACPSPSSLLWFCKSRWVLFSPMVHALRNGVTPAGSRLVCPRSERRFSHHMGQVSWSV